MLSKWGTNVKTGKSGEDLAVNHLEKSGFKVVERNFRTRFGEIDVVAKKGKEYFFVEVKTRAQKDFGSPIESFPFYRVERLKKMALFYATKKNLLEHFLHLSLLGIDWSGEDPEITFLPDII